MKSVLANIVAILQKYIPTFNLHLTKANRYNQACKVSTASGIVEIYVPGGSGSPDPFVVDNHMVGSMFFYILGCLRLSEPTI